MFTNLRSALLLPLAGSLVPKIHFKLTKKKAKKKPQKRSDIVQSGRWRDSFNSALYTVL